MGQPPQHAPTERTVLGMQAETAVCEHLQKAGFTILDRNWRRPWGELDIVASKQAVIHFIEVKASRKRVGGFEPLVRADWRKMSKVQRTARTWLASRRYGPDTEWQLDVASVIMDIQPEIELIEHA